MNNVPQEFLAAYGEIIRNTPSIEHAAQQLENFIQEALVIATSVQAAIEAAKQRATNGG